MIFRRVSKLEQRKEVINLGNLAHYIQKIEEMFGKEELNITEQSLVLSQALERLNVKVKKMQADNMIQEMPLGGLIKRFMNRKEGEE